MTDLGYQFGINDHELAWSNTGGGPGGLQVPISQLTALGVKVHRNDLILEGTSFCSTIGSSTCNTRVASWASQLQDAVVEPLLVVTFSSGMPPSGTGDCANSLATNIANIAAVAAAAPGIAWEFGNEVEDNNPPTAVAYVAAFASFVTAMKAADPTCLVGFGPPANINGGGSGANWIDSLFTAGLAAIPYDFAPFHWYQYPSNVPPTADFDPGFGSPFMSYIPAWLALLTGWGNTKPVWQTEFGWRSLTTSSGDAYPEMTQAYQSQYVTEYLQAMTGQGVPVVLGYELGDSLPGYSATDVWGWMTAGWAAPKLVYTAVQALFAQGTGNFFLFL